MTWGSVIGEIYAERSKKDGRLVRLYSRYWDGIDRPDYTTLQWLDPDAARYLAQQLFQAAEAIDGKAASDRKIAKQVARDAKIKKHTLAIASEAKRAALED